MQTKLILDAMQEEAEKKGSKFDQILDSLDLLFARVTDIGLTQQKIRTHLDLNTQVVDQHTAEQQVMAKQIEEKGQAVARLHLNKSHKQDSLPSDSSSSSPSHVPTTKVRMSILVLPIPYHVMLCPKCYVLISMVITQLCGGINVWITLN